MQSRLNRDWQSGAFLSGGLDSTALVGIMSKFLDTPVKTYSVGFEEGALVNELKHAKMVSEYYETEHTEIIVKSDCYDLLPKIIWHLDDLIADAATIPVYLMSKLARKDMKVVYTGDGADEVFAGYSVFYHRQKIKSLKNLPPRLMNGLMEYYNYIPWHLLRIGLSYAHQSRDLEARYLRKIIHIPDAEKEIMFPYAVGDIAPLIKENYIKGIGLINQFTNWDLLYQLPNQFNMKIDKMAMATSLEIRVPFLDHEIVELASRMPARLKVNDGIEKFILRKAVKDYVPKVVLRRKKVGFNVPINLWLKTGFNGIGGNLLDKLAKRKDILRPKYIKMIKRNREIPYFENRAWNLIMFELWYETFIEKEGLKPIKI